MTIEKQQDFRYTAAKDILCALILSKEEKSVLHSLTNDGDTFDVLLVERAIDLAQTLLKGLEEK